MKNVIILLLILLLSTALIAQTPQKVSVRVYCYIDRDNKPDTRGSGVFITRNQILTCHHVCEHRRDKNHVIVRFNDGFQTWGVVEVESRSMDVCLIRINPHPTFQPMRLGENPVRRDTVRTYGFANESKITKRTGIVSGYLRMHKPPFLERLFQPRMWLIFPSSTQFRLKSDPTGLLFQINNSSCKLCDRQNSSMAGDSGGPVIDFDRVVGIVKGSNIRRGITIAIGADGIREAVGEKLTPSTNPFDDMRFLVFPKQKAKI